MPFCDIGASRIHYQAAGSGFPLLLIPGGGLNATMGFFGGEGPFSAPFDAMKDFASEYRCISLDLRTAYSGQSTGPIEPERPWDAFTDDQLGLLDHLGVDRFLVMGFCMGGPLIWNLLKRAPGRVVAAVLSQPSGVSPDAPTSFYDRNMSDWGPKLSARRPEVGMEAIEQFLRNMALGKDFVYTVDREFVRGCRTPLLVMPDDVPAHPYAVAVESAHLAPHAELSTFPWKDRPENTRIAVRHVRTFLKAYGPSTNNLSREDKGDGTLLA